MAVWLPLQAFAVPLLAGCCLERESAAVADEMPCHEHAGLATVPAVAAHDQAAVVAGDEAAQAGVEGPDVVVLEVDLDEGLPVVVALVQLDAVEHVAAEVERRRVGAAGAPGRVAHVAPAVVEQQAVPALQRVVAQVQARVGLRSAARRSAGRRGRRSSGAAGRRCCSRVLAAPAQHQRLAVAADVGDQLARPSRGAHQRAALAFLRQGVEVADLGDRTARGPT